MTELLLYLLDLDMMSVFVFFLLLFNYICVVENNSI